MQKVLQNAIHEKFKAILEDARILKERFQTCVEAPKILIVKNVKLLKGRNSLKIYKKFSLTN